MGILLAFGTLKSHYSHIYRNENLRIVVHFLFRHHNNSVKLLVKALLQEAIFPATCNAVVLQDKLQTILSV